MFHSTGLFKKVNCPQGSKCSLLNCIFAHAQPENPPQNDGSVVKLVDGPTAALQQDEPPKKRRRLSSGGEAANDENKETGSAAAPQAAAVKHDPSAQNTQTQTPVSTPGQDHPKLPKLRKPPASMKRTVSPPPRRSGTKLGDAQHQKTPTSEKGTSTPTRLTNLPKESLTPRLLAPNPAPHPIRLAILKKIHEQITRLNDDALRDHATKKELVLTENEVITMALDEEEKVGKENPQIYKNVVGHRIQRLKKMKLEEWKSTLLEDFQKKYMPPKPATSKKQKSLDTGLTTRQEIAVLQHILTPLKGLEAHGYVTSNPSATEIKVAEDGVKAGGGFERCDRCGTRFQVFPGRNSDETSKTFGRLTSTENGCSYHWAKPFRPPKSATGAGDAESYYPCCRGALGSKGCTQASDHVFKVSEVKRMASILQFETTPSPPDPDRHSGPVTFDCEMGYTTLGMELIRLSAVSWPGNQLLLDVLVRPLGEVIDYNTRFSGVSQDHFSRAVPYDKTKEPSQQDDGDSTSEDDEPKPLPVVPSPQAARQLLFSHLTPSIPLLGHAIDNDLNTCRIIHPTIVDTVLLFPHPRGLPIRYGLKLLTAKYLDRHIQTSGALGHDPTEDAKATGDLVRYKVGEKWKQMKLSGWTFGDDGSELVSPPAAVQAVKKATQDGPKALKRHISQIDGTISEEEERRRAEKQILEIE